MQSVDPTVNGSEALHQPAMTRPGGYDEAPVPRKAGIRTMVPASWLGMGVELTLTSGDKGAKGVLLDWCPVGPILNVSGAKILYSWDRFVSVELVED